MKKIDINKNSKVRLNYYTKPHNYSEEEVKNLKDSFANKYGISPKQIEVAVKYVKSEKDNGVTINSENIENVQDPRFQLELIKKYLADNGITDYDLDKIREIDSQVNTHVKFDGYVRKSTFSIESIKFDNFLSYGDGNFISFDGFKGLVLLRGNPANQSGKTTLCNDLIHFALYGKVRSGKADSFEHIFNKFRPEKNEVNVEAIIVVNGERYLIQRKLTRPEKGKKTKQIKNEVKFYKLLDGNFREELADADNLKGETTVQTNKALKEAIGEEQDFDLMTCINSANLNEIIYMKGAEMGAAMTRWSGLQIIKDKEKAGKEIWSQKSTTNRYSNVYNRESLALQNQELNNDIEKLKKEQELNENLINETIKKIKGYQETQSALQLSLRKIDERFERVDYHTLIKKLNDIKEEGEKINEEISLMEQEEKQYIGIEYSDTEYKSLSKEEKEIISVIATIKSSIKQLKKDNKELEDGEYCPTCHRKLDNVDNSAIIKANQNKINDFIAQGTELGNRRNVIETRLKELDDLRNMVSKRDRLDAKKSKKLAERGELRSQYKEFQLMKKGVEENKASIEDNNRIQNSLRIINANIENEEKYKNKLINDNSLKNGEIISKNSKIRENNAIIITIEKELYEEKHWKLYLSAVGKDGIIKMILRESIPQINAQIKNLLRDSDIDFDVEVLMNEKNDILFTIKKDNVVAPLSSGSGYEQTVSGLVVRTVITLFSAIPKPPFIILDEVLGSVSSENLPKVKKLFENISKFYEFVFHVTHLNEVVDWHDKVITVNKVNDVSSINIK